MSRITIDIKTNQHKNLKAAASLIGISMKELILRSVNEFLEKNILKLTREQSEGENKLDKVMQIIERNFEKSE